VRLFYSLNPQAALCVYYLITERAMVLDNTLTSLLRTLTIDQLQLCGTSMLQKIVLLDTSTLLAI
jgi:hypothetical protein